MGICFAQAHVIAYAGLAYVLPEPKRHVIAYAGLAYVLPEPKRHVIAYAGWSCVLPEPKGHVIAYAGMSYVLTELKGHVMQDGHRVAYMKNAVKSTRTLLHVLLSWKAMSRRLQRFDW